MPGRTTRSSKTETVASASKDTAAPKSGRKRATHDADTKTGVNGNAAKRVKKEKPEPDFEEAARLVQKIQPDPEASNVSPSKVKSTKTYNLVSGVSPYPSYDRPTREECFQVDKLLSLTHGKKTAPKTVPAPNLQSSGCGEVPSVLDALVRTRLSANTNNANSNRAFQGLVKRFGIVKQGVGKGSVDWDAVRIAPNEDVYEAIKSGGLAAIKSRDIQKILQLVHEENQADDSFKGDHLLSLDHLHKMSTEEAFDKLLTYPGIGPKTASCVLLFCMQRPSFAVDTHVFRICTWLGWVPSPSAVRRMGKEAKADGQKPPPPVSRNTTYAHLDVKIPDELKYSLHYLLIRHGKVCPYCAAKKDSKIREEWGDKKCPIASLKNGKNLEEVKEEAGEAEIKSEEEEEEIKTEEENSDDNDVKSEEE